MQLTGHVYHYQECLTCLTRASCILFLSCCSFCCSCAAIARAWGLLPWIREYRKTGWCKTYCIMSLQVWLSTDDLATISLLEWSVQQLFCAQPTAHVSCVLRSFIDEVQRTEICTKFGSSYDHQQYFTRVNKNLLMKLSNATLMYSTYMNMYVGGVQGTCTRTTTMAKYLRKYSEIPGAHVC